MKIIGKMEGGAVLVEMNRQEIVCLVDNAEVIQRILRPLVAPAAPAPVDKVTAQTARKAKPVKAAKAAPAGKLCAECGKPMTGSQRGGRKTCGDVCRKKRDAKFAREKYRLKMGKMLPAPAANPSDPMLSDEERKAARLALIKSRAEAFGDK